jgi:hypothetical protein
MSFNGSGTFLINTAGQPVVSGTVISSTAFNALTADLATGLSTAITKDGQTTVTANIPMSTYKFTGLGVGSAATDSANLSQVQSTVTKLLTSVSGTDTITAVGAPVVAAYAAGQMFYFVATGDNTGAVTLNIDALGAKAVTRDGSVALAAGDIKSGEVVVVVYDGTRFQVVSQLNSAGNATFANVSITSALNVGGVATFTANPVLSGGTANGVLYLNGSKVATSGTALTFDGTNFGTTGNANLGSGSKSTDTQLNFASDLGTQRIYLDRGTRSLVFYDATTAIENYRIAGITGVQTWGVGGSEQMRLTSTGLGIGTSSPGYKLDVNTTGGSAATARLNGNDQSNVRLRLENAGSGGRTWELVGGLPGANNANFSIRDVTGSTTPLTIDSSGNLGLGVTPSAWLSAFKVLNVGLGSFFGSQNNVYISHIGSNAFFDATDSQWEYLGSDNATRYQQFQGIHSWYNAPSGTAGNTISFTQAMTLDANGNFVLGTTSALSSSYRITSYGGRVNFAGNNDALNLYLQYSNGTAGVFIGSPAANVLAFSDSNGTERARIGADGQFSVSTSLAGSNLVSFTNSSATGYGISVTVNNDSSGTYRYFEGFSSSAAAQKIAIYTNGDVKNTNGVFAAFSDAKLKKDIVDAGSQWDDIKSLRVRKYRLKDDASKALQIGLIAQEVEQVSPGLVNESQDETRDEDGNIVLTGEVTKGVKYSILYMKAVKALQEAMTRIEQLEAKFAALESK